MGCKAVIRSRELHSRVSGSRQQDKQGIVWQKTVNCAITTFKKKDDKLLSTFAHVSSSSLLIISVVLVELEVR